MTADAILDFDDPAIGVEADFAREALLDFLVGHHLHPEGAGKNPVARMGFVERALRGRAEQFGGAVETVEFDEDRAGFLGTASAYRGKGALDMAAANVG